MEMDRFSVGILSFLSGTAFALIVFLFLNFAESNVCRGENYASQYCQCRILLDGDYR